MANKKKQILKYEVEETGEEPLNVEKILRILWDRHEKIGMPARNQAEADYRGIEFNQQLLREWDAERRKQNQ